LCSFPAAAGIEYSAELHDLIADDLAKLYPSLARYTRITIYDVAPRVLSMFDSKLAEYAMEHFSRAGIGIKTARHVEELRRGVPGVDETEMKPMDYQGCQVLRTKEDGEIGVGACIWSTGLMKNPFVERIAEPISHLTASVCGNAAISSVGTTGMRWRIKEDGKTGRIVTDNRLRIKVTVSDASDTSSQSQTEVVLEDVFALGDCAIVENTVLPATAQVANQEAIWLSKRLNKQDLEKNAFSYKNLGMMAYIGDWKAIMQSGWDQEIKGRTAWLLWRTAYMTMAVSLRNKILIPIYW
jgi:NADH dehydrogenase